MSNLTYQVEYTSRPDEVDHIVAFGSDRAKAIRYARHMSDKHDGSAYVLVLRPWAADQSINEAVGHISYVFGIRSDVEGVTK